MLRGLICRIRSKILLWRLNASRRRIRSSSSEGLATINTITDTERSSCENPVLYRGEGGKMNGKNGSMRDASLFNTYNYGEVGYWDARYLGEAGPFDWYQRYAQLKPYINEFVPREGRVLMVGCGNAVISEEMVLDGYQEIINIDISSVVISMMQKKYEKVPQLKYINLDVCDMSCFPDESFDSVIDKGTLDSLMCGVSAPISTTRMLQEVSRVLQPGGVYMLITYGDPRLRMPHLKLPEYNWIISLYIIPRPGFQASSSVLHKTCMVPVQLTDDGLLPPEFVLEDPDSHFIYVCKKNHPTNI